MEGGESGRGEVYRRERGREGGRWKVWMEEGRVPHSDSKHIILMACFSQVIAAELIEELVGGGIQLHQ